MPETCLWHVPRQCLLHSTLLCLWHVSGTYGNQDDASSVILVLPATRTQRSKYLCVEKKLARVLLMFISVGGARNYDSAGSHWCSSLSYLFYRGQYYQWKNSSCSLWRLLCLWKVKFSHHSNVKVNISWLEVIWLVRWDSDLVNLFLHRVSFEWLARETSVLHVTICRIGNFTTGRLVLLQSW